MEEQQRRTVDEVDPNRSIDVAWLSSPAPPPEPQIGRAFLSIWRSRPDLQEAYPGIGLDPMQRAEYLRWVAAFGRYEYGLSSELLDAAAQQAVAISSRSNSELAPDSALDLAPDLASGLTPGIVSVGFHRAVLGVATAGRRLTNLIEASGETVFRRAWDHTTAPLTVPFVDVDDEGFYLPPFDVLLTCVNGEDTDRLMRALGPRATRGRYRIGQWAWELDTISPAQAKGFDHVDEIWVNSRFVQSALRAAAPPQIKIEVIPFGIDEFRTNRASFPTRSQLGLPEGKIVGFAFDFASSIERKNPLALVRAFRSATGPASDAKLVIKCVNSEKFPVERRVLEAEIGGLSDVIVLDRVFTADQQYGFIDALDCYVSLHRSEGYGITLLEAMALDVPVVATGYSGNLDFMTAANSWLIPYRLVSTARTANGGGTAGSSSAGPGQYNTGSLWADPDHLAASRAIKEVLASTAEVKSRCRQARRDADELIDPTQAAQWIAARLRDIRSQARPKAHPAD